MLTSTVIPKPKNSEFPKLIQHQSGSIVLATKKNDDGTFCGTVIRAATGSSHYPLGTCRTDWSSFSDFFGTVELKSE